MPVLFVTSTDVCNRNALYYSSQAIESAVVADSVLYLHF